MENQKVCPFCKGTKFIGTGYTEQIQNGHRVLYPYTEPCYCEINRCIGKRFGILSAVCDAHPKDSEHVHKLYGSDSKLDYLFYGNEELFLYIVKCYFLNGFMFKNYMILEGGTIVEQYNVPKDSSGSWLTTSHLNQYDMLVLMFTTSARYNSLKDCVAEVIKNRSRLAKTTWVYTWTLDHLKDSREYSPELEHYLDTYKKVSLDDHRKYHGYIPRKSESTRQKNEKIMNDSLANI